MSAVIVPATKDGLHPRTLPALIEWGMLPSIELVSSDTDYAALIAHRWRKREKFLVIEQDVEVRFNPEELLKCLWPWCVVIYSGGRDNAGHGAGSSAAMGCVKYDPRKLGAFPLMEAVPWWRLAQEIHDGLRLKGFHPHIHKAKVIHHT